MEAAAAPTTRSLQGEKAERIVQAMRRSVASRGVAGSTFDHVAREAGVSRGLLHYYFGTKERLLAEVVRRDCEVRMAALDAQISGAATPEEESTFKKNSTKWLPKRPRAVPTSRSRCLRPTSTASA